MTHKTFWSTCSCATRFIGAHKIVFQFQSLSSPVNPTEKVGFLKNTKKILEKTSESNMMKCRSMVWMAVFWGAKARSAWSIYHLDGWWMVNDLYFVAACCLGKKQTGGPVVDDGQTLSEITHRVRPSVTVKCHNKVKFKTN